MKNLVLLMSVTAALMVILAGPTYKFGVLDLMTSFSMLKYGLYVAVVALILLLIQLIFKRNSTTIVTVIVSVVCVVIALAVPLSMRSKASSVPPIHDITTDVKNPPEFIAIVPLRVDAPNPITYPGGEVTKQQLAAYPDLNSVTLRADIKIVYQTAQQVIADLGWQQAQGAAENTLEATDSTFWFGFKDDVVIRLTEQGSKTVVDVRSKSRVGQSDLGVNAARIQNFLLKLNEAL